MHKSFKLHEVNQLNRAAYGLINAASNFPEIIEKSYRTLHLEKNRVNYTGVIDKNATNVNSL